MDEKVENPNKENNELPKSVVVKIFDPNRNIVEEIKNMEEEIIIENGKTLISMKQAMEIALSAIPDLEERSIYSFSLEKPTTSSLFDTWGDNFENCWYIIYSSFPKNSEVLFFGPALGIFINKYTGEVRYKGSLGGG